MKDFHQWVASLEGTIEDKSTIKNKVDKDLKFYTGQVCPPYDNRWYCINQDDAGIPGCFITFGDSEEHAKAKYLKALEDEAD